MTELADRPAPPTEEDYRRAALVPPPELLIGAPDQVIEGGRSSVGRNVAALLSSQVLTWGIALVVATLQPRLLGPEGVGQLSLAWSIWAMASVIISFGGSKVITLDTARGSESEGLVGRMLGLQSLLYLASIPVVGLIVLFAGYSARTAVVILLIGFTVPFALVSAGSASVFYGLERMGTPARIDVIGRLVGAAVAIGTLLITDSVIWMALASIFNAVLHATLMLRALHKGTRFRLRPRFVGLAAVAGLGAAFVVINASLVIYQSIDTVVISLLMDPEQLGWYSAADGLFGTMLFVPTIVTSALLPVMARLGRGDDEAARSLVRRSLRLVILVAVPVGLGVTAIATPVCVLLFGSSFEPSGQVLAVYGLVLVITAPSIVLGQYAAAIHRQKLWAAVMVAAIVMTIPLDLVFIPWANSMFDNGAVGGAMSYLVTETFIFTMAVWKITPGVVDRPVVRRCVLAGAAGIVMLAAVWPFRDLFLAVPILIGAVVYTAAVWFGPVLDGDERSMVRRALHSARRLRPS